MGKYSNIFAFFENLWTNIRIYSVVQKIDEWISEYIRTGEMARIRIQIIFEGHFIRIFEYSNICAHHWVSQSVGQSVSHFWENYEKVVRKLWESCQNVARKFQKVSESFKMFQKVSESFRKFRKFRRVSKSFKRFQKVSESFRKFPKDLESFRKFQKVSKGFRKF